MDREPYRRECQRLAEILRQEIRRQSVSIRSLEQKMGVGNSVYQKVLGGKITMTVSHLLQIADALGLEWKELFRRAYLEPEESAGAPPAEEDFDRKVMDVLRRHGLLSQGAAGEEKPLGNEERGLEAQPGTPGKPLEERPDALDH